MHIKNCFLRFIALLLFACLLVSCAGITDDTQSDTENVYFPADSYKDDTTDSETLRAYVLNVGQSSCLVLKSGNMPWLIPAIVRMQAMFFLRFPTRSILGQAEYHICFLHIMMRTILVQVPVSFKS